MAGRNKLRPHVLKVDAEGHDYEVLMSFINPDVSDAQLPLLIDFEAKSLRDNYKDTVTLLQSRGYVVSEIQNDGFALLKADAFIRKKKSKAGGKKKKRQSGDGGEGGEEEGEEAEAEGAAEAE